MLETLTLLESLEEQRQVTWFQPWPRVLHRDVNKDIGSSLPDLRFSSNSVTYSSWRRSTLIRERRIESYINRNDDLPRWRCRYVRELDGYRIEERRSISANTIYRRREIPLDIKFVTICPKRFRSATILSTPTTESESPKLISKVMFFLKLHISMFVSSPVNNHPHLQLVLFG